MNCTAVVAAASDGGESRVNALEGKQVVVDPCQPRHTPHRGGGGGGCKVGRQSPTLSWKHKPVYSLIFILLQRHICQQGAVGESKDRIENNDKNNPEVRE